ncbi:MAG TPA: amidase [Steroidobacteraceae bacterium]|nr:amidase [Steroidobacteraceae bacterium]
MNAYTEASPLVRMSAVELTRAIRARQVSCAEVMATFLDHLGGLNPRVNALVSLEDAERLMQRARVRDAQLARGGYLGRLHGLPHAVKDLAFTAGIRTTRGSPLTDTVPEHDAILVERLRAGGAILIGKTNTAEFGLGSQTYNPVFGTTLNAYDTSKTAGGSSGGAAVALALRMVPLADGSDMMGSLRNPAAYNNVFGLRPTAGRVPVAGEELFLDLLSVWGPMGRSAADLAMLMSVIAGADARAPQSGGEDPGEFLQPLERDLRGARIGWLGDLGGYLPFEPGILELCESACGVLAGLGCLLEEATLPCSPAALWEAWVTLRHWLIAGDLEPLYREPAMRARLKPEACWEVESAAALTALDVYRASVARSRWYSAAGELFEHFDFLALPSAQLFPFDAAVPWPRSINGVAMDTYHRWMEVVVPASLLGGPVLNVPVGFSPAGLPMGMQLIGPRHADFALLQLGHAYDEETRWVSRRPPPLLAGQRSAERARADGAAS